MSIAVHAQLDQYSFDFIAPQGILVMSVHIVMFISRKLLGKYFRGITLIYPCTLVAYIQYKQTSFAAVLSLLLLIMETLHEHPTQQLNS